MVRALLTLFLVTMFASGLRAQGTGSAQDSRTMQPPPAYDLVIAGGRVMDPETGFDAVANVGIRNGRIAAIGKDAMSGAETINAAGHVVSPGFIDTHVHIVDHPFGQKLMLRDGVTTTLDLEVGAWPVARFYDHMDGRSQTNYGATVSALGVRESVFNPKYNPETGILTTDSFSESPRSFVDMKWSPTVPTAKQIDDITARVDEGLREGAIGMGRRSATPSKV